MFCYSKNHVLLLFANWSDLTITADFVAVGPVLSTKVNF